ncbi:cytidine deaminase [Pseudoalteromonas fenneropenaei]|uniref:Cytidine deaminase n=1 Tax=Pseudoalteromonas fenneropenaei TaxID=1737459 RepID=A0ABV7CQK8_9GAMM
MTSSTTQHIFTPEQSADIKALLTLQRGKLNHAQVEHLCTRHSCDIDALMLALLPLAAQFAGPSISHFYVGAVVLDTSNAPYGELYVGANLEFKHQALSLVVHAEQAAINNAWLQGAKSIDKIAITDAPCGYCRQFMNELASADELKIALPHHSATLRELLPQPFGPSDLANPHSLFASPKVNLSASGDVSTDLLAAAEHSYAPYSGNYSAVEIVTNKGNFIGRYAENAAYSPSLSPLQSALSQMVLAGNTLEQVAILRVTLLECQGHENQADVAKAVINSFDYPITFEQISAVKC